MRFLPYVFIEEREYIEKKTASGKLSDKLVLVVFGGWFVIEIKQHCFFEGKLNLQDHLTDHNNIISPVHQMIHHVVVFPVSYS